jgi:predicted nuclease of predicted toxin-antitoxin system
MKFLANENFPLPSAVLLRKIGLDVRHIAEDCPSVKDSAVMKIARDEDRIIITFDRDYGELVFRRMLPPPPGIIYLRFKPYYPAEPGEVIANLISTAQISFSGKFTVIKSDGHIRQRSLLI